MKRRGIACVFSSLAANCAAQATYLPLGDLPGGEFGSVGFALSGDGHIATGFSIDRDGLLGTNAFRWSASDGMISLAQPSGRTDGNGISTSGQYIAGSIEDASGVRGAFWTASGDFHTVGDLPGGADYSILADVSDNGIAVGASSYASGPFAPLQQAIRWTQQGGIEPLGFLPGDDYSFAVDISADGSTIAGRGASGVWTWTSTSGMALAVGKGFELQGMTGDGQYLFGVNSTILGGQSVGVGALWSEDAGLIELNHDDTPASWISDVAKAASHDADVILGMRFALSGGSVPYVWFDQGLTGMTLEDYLLDNGLDLRNEGYRITDVSDISNDGSRFLVNTFNPEGKTESLLIVVPANSTFVAFGLSAIGFSRRRRKPNGVQEVCL